MNPVGESGTVEDYRRLAEHEAADSAVLAGWARGVAGDPEVLELVDRLPTAKRQPNLVFAAARWHGAEPGPYAAAGGLREVLLERWDDVRATALSRSTQTNEVGRCATLLPVLAQLPGPLALIEVGASAGLCLALDRYSYRWAGSWHADLDPVDGPSPVVLDCEVHGDPPGGRLPVMPEVVWRRGVDLNPLDVRDEDAMAWLQTLVWPEHDDRRARLGAAARLVRDDPPPVVRGDLLEALPDLAADAPPDATLVVFHSAVAAYLSGPDRERLEALARALPGHWLSNEGPRVLPALAPPGPPPGTAAGPAPFVLALDGRPVAWTHGHGRSAQWLAGRVP